MGKKRRGRKIRQHAPESGRTCLKEWHGWESGDAVPSRKESNITRRKKKKGPQNGKYCLSLTGCRVMFSPNRQTRGMNRAFFNKKENKAKRKGSLRNLIFEIRKQRRSHLGPSINSTRLHAVSGRGKILLKKGKNQVSPKNAKPAKGGGGGILLKDEETLFSKESFEKDQLPSLGIKKNEAGRTEGMHHQRLHQVVREKKPDCPSGENGGRGDGKASSRSLNK